MARIQLTTPDGNTFEAELHGEHMTLGRNDDNQLAIPDGSVSGSHGEFVFEGGQWSFNDLGSTNGTKINGELVQRVELGHGAEFHVGDVHVVFVEDAEAPAPASRASSPAASRHAPADGYNSRPLDRSSRIGFGPAKVKRDGGRAALMFFGVIGLLVTIGVIALFFTQGL